MQLFTGLSVRKLGLVFNFVYEKSKEINYWRGESEAKVSCIILWRLNSLYLSSNSSGYCFMYSRLPCSRKTQNRSNHHLFFQSKHFLVIFHHWTVRLILCLRERNAKNVFLRVAGFVAVIGNLQKFQEYDLRLMKLDKASTSVY